MVIRLRKTVMKRIYEKNTFNKVVLTQRSYFVRNTS